LFVAFYASAELNCHRALNWPMPARVLDLFAEFRNRFNGLNPPAGCGLLRALAAFGEDVMPATRKDTMREMGITMRNRKISYAEKIAEIERSEPGWCAQLLKDFARQRYTGGGTKAAVQLAVNRKYDSSRKRD
jgi:hypothetical protein